MKPILLTLACASIQFFANSQSQGPFTAGNFTNLPLPGSSGSWTNLNNAAGSDDQYASFTNLPDNVGDYTDYLEAKGFNFNIPAATIIKGVVVEVENSDPNKLTADYEVLLNIPGSADYSNKTTFSDFDVTTVYGSSTDLWGQALDAGKINDPGFGVRIAVQRDGNGGATLGRIDNIRITVYYSFIILPVHLQSFTAINNENSVQINWTTTDESGIDQYQVERSADSRIFSPISSLDARNTSGLNHYSLLDRSAYTGRSYYRLRIVSSSGEAQFSNIITVQRSKKHMVEIYPNPVRGEKLYLNNPAREEFNIQFYNSLGKLITTIATTNSEFPVPELCQTNNNLIYQVRNRNHEIVGSGRIIIQ